jgi:cold shock CspA family protein
MNASTQSQPSTNKPLPKTQQSLLWKLERFPSLLIWDQSSVAKTAKVLAKKGMIAGVAQGDGFTRYTLVKVEAPIATEEAASEDELSAKMPLAPLMDADTMPVMDVQTVATKPEYAEGQIVRFHYWLSNVDNSVYTGRINGFKSSVTFGETALIEPIKNAYHLTPRYVPMSRIIEVVSNEADVFEPAFTFADVQRLEKAWFAAQSAPRNFDEAISEPFYSRTRNAHTAYLIAYAMFHNAPWMMPCAEDIEALRSRSNAPQTPHNGPSAVVDDVQAFSANLDQRKPEIASEPVMQQSVETSRIEGHVKTYNKKEGWGYIVTSDGNEYYFRNTNLHRIASAHHLNRGTSVTFVPMTAIGENAGMAKATGVMIGSYIPDVRPMHQINPSINLEVKEAEQARKGKKQEQRIFRQKQADKNAASMKRVMGGGL